MNTIKFLSALILVFILSACGENDKADTVFSSDTGSKNIYFPVDIIKSRSYLVTDYSSNNTYYRYSTLKSYNDNGFVIDNKNSKDTYTIQTNYFYDGNAVKYSDILVYMNGNTLYLESNSNPAELIFPSSLSDGFIETTTSNVNQINHLKSTGIEYSKTVTVTVIGNEIITVPAGSFNTKKIKINSITTPLLYPWDESIEFIWYANTVGEIKAESYNSNMNILSKTELTAYGK